MSKKIKIFTLHFSPENGGFIADELESFLASKEICDITEHFFVYNTRPYWAIMITYQEATNTKQTFQPQLLPSQQKLWKMLQKWRITRANADGVPVYLILHNQQLLDIVHNLPESQNALTKIRGIGESKAKLYGPEILKVISTWTENPDKDL